MRAILLIIAIGFLSCTSIKSSEKQLYDCWIESFKGCDIDLISEIQNFENDLIKNGYLDGNSGISYMHLIDSLSKLTMPMIVRTIPMHGFLKATFKLDKKCLDSVDMAQIPKLTLLHCDFEQALSDKKMEYHFVYQKISQTLDNRDFENDLYKTWISWILISNSIYSDLFKDLSPKDKVVAKTSITISIDSLTNYYIDNKMVDFGEIEQKIQEMKVADTNLKVGFKPDKSVAISKVTEIMRICKKNDVELKLAPD